MYSCHKDSASPKGPDPIKVDLSSKTNCSLTGYVIDESGDAIPFAFVAVCGNQVLSDDFGYFSFSSVSLPASVGMIKWMSNGYFTTYRSFIPQKD